MPSRNPAVNQRRTYASRSTLVDRHAEPLERLDHRNGEHRERAEEILLVDRLAPHRHVELPVVMQHVPDRGVEQPYAVCRSVRIGVGARTVARHVRRSHP